MSVADAARSGISPVIRGWDQDGADLSFHSLDANEHIIVEVVHSGERGDIPMVAGTLVGGRFAPQPRDPVSVVGEGVYLCCMAGAGFLLGRWRTHMGSIWPVLGLFCTGWAGFALATSTRMRQHRAALLAAISRRLRRFGVSARHASQNRQDSQ